MPTLILYEYPFHESVRTLLRLEALFDRLFQLIPLDAPMHHHFALSTLFEIIDVGARTDVKGDMMKELERQRLHFNGLRGNPAIAESALNTLLQQLDSAYENLSQMTGKVGNALLSSEWLVALRSRMAIPGGTRDFDLPAYHAWRHHSAEDRQNDLRRWAATLRPVIEGMNLLLALIRDTGKTQQCKAEAGQFQQSLPPNRTFQLLQLKIDPDLDLIPEITGHRLMVFVRFMEPNEAGHLKLAQKDASFEMTLCG
jgi:cell division protein ZapD